MALKLDHLAVTGATVEAAAAHVEEALGVPMQPGGRHDHFGTHNHLLHLADGLYLEAIAIDPAAPALTHTRWFDMDRFQGPPRLTNWICATDDMDDLLPQFPAGCGAPVALERGAYAWRMAVPEDGILPFDNAFPAIIQWHCEDHPAFALQDQGVRLREVEVSLPDPVGLFELLAPHLSDKRVHIMPGPRELRARFDTPHGVRVLE